MKKITRPTQKVLYQKLGDLWYAFTEKGDEILYSALPEGVDPRETPTELYTVVEEENFPKERKKNERLLEKVVLKF